MEDREYENKAVREEYDVVVGGADSTPTGMQRAYDCLSAPGSARRVVVS